MYKKPTLNFCFSSSNSWFQSYSTFLEQPARIPLVTRRPALKKRNLCCFGESVNCAKDRNRTFTPSVLSFVFQSRFEAEIYRTINHAIFP